MIERAVTEARRRASGERALADVRRIAEHHRIQASPGYDAAARWLEDALRAAGFEPERVEVPGDGRTRYGGFVMPEGWDCAHARATLHGERGAEPAADFAHAPLSIVQRSDPARGRWPLVVADTPDALEQAEVRGHVVLSALPVALVHERAVCGRGAAGLVCDARRLMPPVRTAEHDPDSLAYTSFWWYADEPRGFGVVVSPARGREWRARLARGERLQLEVDFACTRGARVIPLVTACLPGTLPGEVLVTGHLCHPKPGANDNASGAAAVLETARVLSGLAADGVLPSERRTVRFLWMPEFTGTYAWQALHPEHVAATVAAINLDMVGERQSDCGSTLLLEQAPHFLGSFADDLLARIRTASQDWVTDFSGAGQYSLARLADVPYSGGSDHAVWLDPAVGVPCPMLIQWPDRYYHSDLDTPERVDPASLALAVRAAAAYAAVIASAGGEDVRALLQLTGRAARRRLIAALDGASPALAAAAARERGQRALASVARLGLGLGGAHPVRVMIERELPLAVEELEGFWDAEVAPALAREVPVALPSGGRVPQRAQAALLSPIRRLTEGWESLPPAARERWRDAESALAGGSTSADLAWFACDGERGVGDIAALLRREGAAVTPEQLEHWFDAIAAAGAVRWRDGGRGSRGA